MHQWVHGYLLFLTNFNIVQSVVTETGRSFKCVSQTEHLDDWLGIAGTHSKVPCVCKPSSVESFKYSRFYPCFLDFVLVKFEIF